MAKSGQKGTTLQPNADFHPRHDQSVVVNPNIIADQGVTLARQFIGLGHDLLPAVAK